MTEYTLDHINRICSRYHMSFSDLLILEALSFGDKCPTEIADICKRTTAAATGRIDAMVTARLVTRSHHADDRRKIIVSIMQRGIEIIQDLERKECGLPPRGWICTREYGHEGPCAAVSESPHVTLSPALMP